jgi:NAD(P)-dependent dehydrogenase (short-subunit alcohol dehydrogenase family)
MNEGDAPGGRLAGKHAVVAGGSRGIGRAVALALAKEGAAIVVNGRHREPADEVVERIEEAGGRAIGCIGSVADFEFAHELVESCVDAFGSIDVLINCAGTAEPTGSSILDLSAHAWRELIDSHLTSTFNCCRHAAPRMVEQGSGAIVNTSSHSYLGHYGGTGYPAGKGGVNSLTYAIAAELREHGVRVNAVCPGGKTRLSTGPDYEDRIEDLHARGILDDAAKTASLSPPDPEHVGPLYTFLSSDAAKEITGRLFSAVGGYVGLHAQHTETLLAYRNPSQDAWPLNELEQQLQATLNSDTIPPAN